MSRTGPPAKDDAARGSIRLFVAIDVGEQRAAAAGRVIDDLRAAARRLAPRARITWVTPAHMHLTLCFIGEVDVDRVSVIEDVLRPAIPHEPFTLSFGGLGVFPPRGPARVIWLGVTKGEDSVAALRAHVSARLARTGVPLESKPFHPHLTLGRVRDPAGLRAPLLFKAHDDDAAIGSVRVEGCTLFESRLLPEGPRHTARLEIGLTGSPGGCDTQKSTSQSRTSSNPRSS